MNKILLLPTLPYVKEVFKKIDQKEKSNNA